MSYYNKEQLAAFQQQTFAYIKCREEANVFYLTLHRPERKNALNLTMLNEIAYAIAYANQETSIWMLVIDAVGDIFCAGADLKAFSGEVDENDSTIPEPSERIVIAEVFEQCYKPCIAKVDKPVLAGGMLLLTGCTHVIAAEDVYFVLPEVKRGLFPFQVMANLLKVMTKRSVLDWCIRGSSLSGTKALALGLITSLVPANKTTEAVDTLLNELKEGSPTATQLGLESLQALETMAEEDKQQFLMQKFLECLVTADAKEGILAFKQKRKPNWNGIK